MSTEGPSERPLLAIDMDDVLVTTNGAIAKWHNKTYGTDMKLSDFRYYHYWKNPGWGSIPETMEKVEAFISSTEPLEAQPVAGAIQGITELRRLGFRLAIVTARGRKQKDITERWIKKHFSADSFEAIHYTGEFEDKEAPHPGHKMGKAEIIHAIGAIGLVDDAMENAMSVTSSVLPVPVLLFGQYEWNRRYSKVQESKDYLSFAERQEQDPGPWWEKDVIPDTELPGGIQRVVDWSRVPEACKEIFMEFINN